MEFPIEPEIKVNKGVDPHKIGKHYSKLHQAIHEKDYQKQGFNSQTNYRVEKGNRGESIVNLFVDLTKKP